MFWKNHCKIIFKMQFLPSRKTLKLTAVDFGERTDARATHVQVACDRSTSHVEPVDIGGRELVEDASLDNVVPVGNFEFTSPRRFEKICKI